MRACRELGIQSVAVYSDIDVKSPHVRYADEAYHVGGALSADSYLRVERLLEVARESNVDAIHPGYGSSSENAGLCSGGTRCWVFWIGPNPVQLWLWGRRRLLVKRW